MDLPENMSVLRLFGAEKAGVEALMQQAEHSNGIQMQQMAQGSETLLLLEAETRSGSATSAILYAWEERVASLCGGALYGKNDSTLQQSVLDGLLNAAQLFVCVDAQTAALVTPKLGGLKGLNQVYDFGKHSYANEKIYRKIANGSRFAAKFPDQSAQQIAGQLKAAYQYSGADFVLATLPFEDGSQLIFVGEKTDYLLRRVPKGENAALWLLDLLRRTSQGEPQAKGTIQLSYGAKLPAFAIVGDLQAEDESILTPQQSEFDAPPPPQRNPKGTSGVVFAVAMVLLVAVLGVALLYVYTGGDIASLWNSSGLNQYNVSSATLL